MSDKGNIQKAKKLKKKKNEIFNIDNLTYVRFFYRGASIGFLNKEWYNKLRKEFKYRKDFDYTLSFLILDGYCDMINNKTFDQLTDEEKGGAILEWSFLIYELVRRNLLKNDDKNGLMKIYKHEDYDYNFVKI